MAKQMANGCVMPIACTERVHACCAVSRSLFNFAMAYPQVTRYLGYSSLKDFFPTMDIKPNPGCANALCSKRQQQFQQQQSSPEAQQRRQAAAQAAALEDQQAAQHTENEWGIEVVPEVVPDSASAASQSNGDSQVVQHSSKASSSYDHTLPEGLHYSVPVGLALTSLLHCNCLAVAWRLDMDVSQAVCTEDHHNAMPTGSTLRSSIDLHESLNEQADAMTSNVTP